MALNGGAVGDIRSDWTLEEVRALHALPFSDLIHAAQLAHRRYFDPNQVQVSTLLSIKTGACPEDCAYCPQSIRYDTGLEREPLMEPAAVVARARAAREAGATRFCMGAAWRSPKDRDLDHVVEMVRGVADLGLETCATLGMLTEAPGPSPARRGTRLLQSQSRYVREVLRGSDHDAHLPGSPRHARRRARRRNQRLLRRHPRHGRAGGRPDRIPAHARDARSASRERADQQPRAGRGHAARRYCPRSIRSSSSASSRSRAS